MQSRVLHAQADFQGFATYVDKLKHASSDMEGAASRIQALHRPAASSHPSQPSWRRR